MNLAVDRLTSVITLAPRAVAMDNRGNLDKNPTYSAELSSTDANGHLISAAETDSTPKHKRRHRPEQKAVMMKWLRQHMHHPYPEPEDMAAMAREARLNIPQVRYWFINARVRFVVRSPNVLFCCVSLSRTSLVDLAYSPHIIHHSAKKLCLKIHFFLVV